MHVLGVMFVIAAIFILYEFIQAPLSDSMTKFSGRTRANKKRRRARRVRLRRKFENRNQDESLIEQTSTTSESSVYNAQSALSTKDFHHKEDPMTKRKTTKEFLIQPKDDNQSSVDNTSMDSHDLDPIAEIEENLAQRLKAEEVDSYMSSIF